MKESRDATIAVRVAGALVDAIDAEVARQRNARPGVNVRRSDVVRELLIRHFMRNKGKPEPALPKHRVAPGERVSHRRVRAGV